MLDLFCAGTYCLLQALQYVLHNELQLWDKENIPYLRCGENAKYWEMIAE